MLNFEETTKSLKVTLNNGAFSVTKLARTGKFGRFFPISLTSAFHN